VNEKLGEPSNFNLHLARFLSNEFDHRSLGCDITEPEFMLTAMERLVTLRIDSVQMFMIEFVPCDISSKSKLAANLRFYVEKGIQMNELVKHCDFLDPGKNIAHVYKLAVEDTCNMNPFSERCEMEEYHEENYFLKVAGDSEVSRALACRQRGANLPILKLKNAQVYISRYLRVSKEQIQGIP
jgi:hypothetical protein